MRDFHVGEVAIAWKALDAEANATRSAGIQGQTPRAGEGARVERRDPPDEFLASGALEGYFFDHELLAAKSAPEAHRMSFHIVSSAYWWIRQGATLNETRRRFNAKSQTFVMKIDGFMRRCALDDDTSLRDVVA